MFFEYLSHHSYIFVGAIKDSLQLQCLVGLCLVASDDIANLSAPFSSGCSFSIELCIYIDTLPFGTE